MLHQCLRATNVAILPDPVVKSSPLSPSLNHPNIAHIHGIERGASAETSATDEPTATTTALAMELVEGPTPDNLQPDRCQKPPRRSVPRSAGTASPK